MSVFIIADAGINHEGSIEKAEILIKMAKASGADAIKFQDGFKTIPQLQKYSLTKDQHRYLKSYCYCMEIEYMCTAFDFEFMQFLKDIKVQTWKIPSGENKNVEYFKRIPKGSKVLVSTGGLDDKGIYEISRNFVYPDYELVIMHCVSEYPCDIKNANMKYVNNRVYSMGYSDHTMTYTTAIMAVAMGAGYIEHHIMGDWKCIDEAVSFSVFPFTEYVKLIREAEVALGSSNKNPTAKEMELMAWARNRAG